MIQTARPVALIVDARRAGRVGELLAGEDDFIRLVIFPDTKRATVPTNARAESRTVRGEEDVAPTSAYPRHGFSATADAYLMFTSGTTGRPKCVRVPQASVLSYLAAIQDLIELQPHDRTTQLFELTFDLSVHDMFVTWAAGACLYVFQDADLLAPVHMVQRFQLTTWFSVPTLAAMVRQRLRTEPGLLSSLRITLFCGEALSPALAEEWQQAAPSSAIYNLYGPTETTIAVTAFRFGSADLPTNLSTVPIGHPFPGQRTIILDEGGSPVPQGTEGELVIAGSQVTAGYVDDPSATAASFITATLDGRERRWYRTGDRARHDARLGLIFLGRHDLQVKVNGYRVELLEVEEVLRRAADCTLVAAVPWPLEEAAGASAIVGVVCGSDVPAAEVIRRCALSLPVYMLPRQILRTDAMPLNSSGKVDRAAVRILCDESVELRGDPQVRGSRAKAQ